MAKKQSKPAVVDEAPPEDVNVVVDDGKAQTETDIDVDDASALVDVIAGAMEDDKAPTAAEKDTKPVPVAEDKLATEEEDESAGEPSEAEELPEEPVLSPVVMRRALDMGFAEADLQGMGNAEVERSMTALDRRLLSMSMGQNPNLQAPLQQQPQQPPTPQYPGHPQAPTPTPFVPQPAGPPAGNGRDQQPAPDFRYTVQLGEDVDESITRTLQAMSDHNAHHMTQMAQAFGEIYPQVQHVATEAEQARMSRLDDRIAKLGEEYHADDKLGKGGEHELLPTSTAYRNRAEVYRVQQVLPGLYRQNNMRVPSESAVFRAALDQVFAGDKEVLARRHVAAKVKKRSEQVSHRPTRREGRQLTPDESVDAATKEFMRERGITDVADKADPIINALPV